MPDIEVEVTPGEHERWIVAYLRRRYPALEAQHRAAYEAFRAYLRTGRIDEADFLKIVGVARSTHAGLWGTGTDWLARLTREHPPAHDALRAMARDKVAQVRFNALCCIGTRTDRQLARDVVLPAIDDKAGKVRTRAGDVALFIELREAVGPLERRVALEKNPRVRRSLEYDLRLLRDGYALEPCPGGAMLSAGGVGGTRGGFVEQEALDRRGPAAIAQEWRAEMRRSLLRTKWLP